MTDVSEALTARPLALSLITLSNIKESIERLTGKSTSFWAIQTKVQTELIIYAEKQCGIKRRATPPTLKEKDRFAQLESDPARDEQRLSRCQKLQA